MQALEATKRVLRSRTVTAAELSFLLFSLVLHCGWITTVLYAFEQGGVAEAGIVSLVVVLPGAILAPLTSVWLDRFPARVAFAVVYMTQAIFFAVVAGVISADGPALIVYLGMTVASAVQMGIRPAMSSALPRIVADPAELAAANAVMGMIEMVGLVGGPLTAAALLGGGRLELPMVACAVGALTAVGVGSLVTPHKIGIEIDRQIEGPAASAFGWIRGCMRAIASPPITTA